MTTASAAPGPGASAAEQQRRPGFFRRLRHDTVPQMVAETISLTIGGLVFLMLGGVGVFAWLVIDSFELLTFGRRPSGSFFLELALLATLGLLLAWIFTAVSQDWAHVHRSRVASLVGHIHPQGLISAPARRHSWTAAPKLNLSDPEVRRRAGWTVVGVLLSPVMLAVVAIPFVVVPVGLLMPLGNLPGITAEGAYLLRGLLLFLLTLAPGLIRWVSRADVWVVSRMWGADDREQLQRRFEEMAESRDSAVSAADAERRRIERDLHDGAQQRLTALAMRLGMARQRHEIDPHKPVDPELISAAQGEVREALTEIRSIVRGLHPAVLEDRGLDAAVSGIASRVPHPVEVDIRIEDRPHAHIESVAYFVISEAVTNMVRHADASYGTVWARREADTVRLVITDDGEGGAVSALHSGLDGLEQRVRSVGGTMTIASPRGEGTRIEVELPCA
ncbi:sensor histidine kinase [Nesterenkonia populi]